VTLHVQINSWSASQTNKLYCRMTKNRCQGLEEFRAKSAPNNLLHNNKIQRQLCFTSKMYGDI